METTPSSTRRVTRSQTKASSMDSRQMSTKNQQQDQSTLADITNDSPIFGLAMGNLKTPSLAKSKTRVVNQGQLARTPGSGEALLRGQVKNLLQKVEEEAELSKITIENRPFFDLQSFVTSPINLVAPTLENTPCVLNFSADSDGLPCVTPSLVQEKFLVPQSVDEKKEESVEYENVITRSLLLDFSEKDSSDCFSVLTYQAVVYGERENRREKCSSEDDGASVWPIQVNASSTREDEEVVDELVKE